VATFSGMPEGTAEVKASGSSETDCQNARLRRALGGVSPPSAIFISVAAFGMGCAFAIVAIVAVPMGDSTTGVRKSLERGDVTVTRGVATRGAATLRLVGRLARCKDLSLATLSDLVRVMLTPLLLFSLSDTGDDGADG